jgi:hypothetical protein
MLSYVGNTYTQVDMPSTTPSGTDTTFNSTTINGLSSCMPPFAAAGSLAAGTATFSGWFKNTSAGKTCTLGLGVFKNKVFDNMGHGYNGAPPGFSIPPMASPTLVTTSFPTVARSYIAGDQISISIAGWKSSPTNCSGTTFYYNSAAHPSSLTMPLSGSGGVTVATPNPPTGLTVTANGDGTRTLNWTAPTSTGTIPAPDFYRIYRDGTATSTRIDTADAINTSVSSASAAAATTLSVAGTSGYAAGQTLLVDTGANQDTMTISSVTSNSITFTAGMPHAHAVNVPVVLRAVSWTDTATGGSSHTYRVTAVSSALAESSFLGPIAG